MQRKMHAKLFDCEKTMEAKAQRSERKEIEMDALNYSPLDMYKCHVARHCEIPKRIESIGTVLKIYRHTACAFEIQLT